MKLSASHSLREKLASHKKLAIGVTILFGLAIGLGLHSLSQAPRKPATLKELIRELREQDSRLDALHQDLWLICPTAIKIRLPGLEPIPAVLRRRVASGELASFGPAAAPALPGLVKALGDPDQEVRFSAVQALAAVGPAARSAIPALLQTASDRSFPTLQPGALTALAVLDGRDSKVRSALLEIARRDPDHTLRTHALRTLGQVPPSDETLDVLIEFAQSSDWDIKEAAIDALGMVGPKAARSVPVLVKLFDHPAGEDVPEADASTVMARWVPSSTTITAVSTAPRPGALMAPPVPVPPPFSNPIQPALPPAMAANIATNPAFAATTGVFVRYGIRPAFSQTSSILRALGRIGPAAQDALPLVLRESTNPGSPYRVQAACVRWQIEQDSAAVMPLLRNALHEQLSQVRLLAIEHLEQMGPVAVPLLIEALGDTQMQVRLAAVQALGRLAPHSAAAVPLFEIMLEHDPKFCVRGAVRKTLTQIRPPRPSPPPHRRTE